MSLSPRKPGIVIAPAWYGIDDFARDKALALHALGFVTHIADIYGTMASNDDEALALMTPFIEDRARLRSRMEEAFEILKKNPEVDPNRIGAIGFCFGGLAVIELLRSGAPVKGVVSFHGVLKQGNTPLASHIAGAALILHGHDDPSVSADDIKALQDEFTEAHIDWQMHLYGHTVHAFTNPLMNEAGRKFNPQANKRSWESMKAFFAEVL